MLWEARGRNGAENRGEGDLFGLRIMLLLALATSIDALAVGITLPMLNAPFVTSLLTIWHHHRGAECPRVVRRSEVRRPAGQASRRRGGPRTHRSRGENPHSASPRS